MLVVSASKDISSSRISRMTLRIGPLSTGRAVVNGCAEPRLVNAVSVPYPTTSVYTTRIVTILQLAHQADSQ